MDYLEFKISIGPGEKRDIIIGMLSEEGFESFSEEQDLLVAYIPVKLYNKIKVKSLLERFSVAWQSSIIMDQNWNEEWEKHYDPVLVSEKCYIRAPFHPPLEGVKFDIIIEPKMSFGTAHHETTVLMIQLMMECDLKGRKVLDMGCGTGILAIFAKMLGAAGVLAVDNDEWAYNNCRENIERNKIENLIVVMGNVRSVREKEFDVVMANINRNVLLGDMRDYSALMKNGELLLSGFYKEDIPSITEKAESAGFTFTSMMSRNNWVAMKFRK